MFRTAVVGNYSSCLSEEERSGMAFLYEKLKKVIEAVHILHTRQSKVEKHEKER
jgi:hypothetical protein